MPTARCPKCKSTRISKEVEAIARVSVNTGRPIGIKEYGFQYNSILYCVKCEYEAKRDEFYPKARRR